MNTNKKVNASRITRAKRTLLGKVLCRLAGEDTGAVMMEYVIVAVVIAAAVMAGAWFFGRDILNMFGVAGQAVTGNQKGAYEMAGEAVGKAKDGHDSAKDTSKKFINTDNEDKADTTKGGDALTNK